MLILYILSEPEAHLLNRRDNDLKLQFLYLWYFQHDRRDLTRTLISRSRPTISLQLRAGNLIVLDKGDVNLDTVDLCEYRVSWQIWCLYRDLSFYSNRSIFAGGKGAIEKIELVVT
jgi:hypothetical protein